MAGKSRIYTVPTTPHLITKTKNKTKQNKCKNKQQQQKRKQKPYTLETPCALFFSSIPEQLIMSELDETSHSNAH